MSSIILPSRRIAQPYGSVEVDWGNSFTANLQILYSAKSGLECVKKAHAIRGAGYEIRATRNGAALLGKTNSYATTVLPGAKYSDEVTFFAVVEGRDVAQSQTVGISWSGVGDSFTAAGNTGIGQADYGSGRAVQASVYYYPDFNGTIATSAISTKINPREKLVLVGVYTRSATLKLYANGVEIASVATGNFAANLGYAGRVPYVLSNLAGSVDALMSGIAYRAWSSADVFKFSANPWQIFKPASNRIWFDSAVGGGGVYSLSDSGSGSDAISISVSFSLSDTGAGTDLQPAPGAALTLLDDGASADAVSLAALLAVTDTGAGSDADAVSVAFALADSGSGADAISILTQLLVSVSDAASGVDGVSIQAQIALADSGSGADTPVLYISISVADTASGADALSVLQQLLVSVADIASGTDSLSLGSGLTVTDAGAGLEGMAIAINVPVGDAGSGMDVPAIQAWLALVESATGMDATVAFDTNKRIATILFKLAHRAMTFTLASRQISFTLN